jgi:hypothetical protein
MHVADGLEQKQLEQEQFHNRMDPRAATATNTSVGVV